MASWQDGPEYAPRDRPEAFVEPLVSPLDVPAQPGDLSAGAPAELPSFISPETPVPDLATLIPAAAAPVRDPRLAFDVVTTPLTSSNAWGSAHTDAARARGELGGPAGNGPDQQSQSLPGPSGQAQPSWSPQQPLSTHSTPFTGSVAQQRGVQPGAQLNPAPFPSPGTPQWFAPPDPGERYQPSPPVSIGAIWRGVTPGVVIALLLGVVLNPLSIVLLPVSYGLATRIGYRRRQVRVCFGVAAGFVGLVWLWNLVMDDFYLDSAWSAASGAAQIASGGLLIALVLVVAVALSRGEKPEVRP